MEIQSASFFVMINDFNLGCLLLSEVLSKQYLGVGCLNPKDYKSFKQDFIIKLSYCKGIIRANQSLHLKEWDKALKYLHYCAKLLNKTD